MTEVDGAMVIGLPKNGKERTVPLTAFMAGRLGERLQGKGRDVLVFPSERGHHLRTNNFKTRECDPAVEGVGLPEGLWIHELRHTAASLAVPRGPR